MEPEGSPTVSEATPVPSFGVRSLFERFADGVYTLAYRLLRDLHAAEDVVQETFLTAVRRLDTYRGEGSIGGWLYRIAYHHTIAALRGRRDLPTDPSDLPDTPDADASVEQRVLMGELAVQLDRAIARLEPCLRAAFVLRDVEELSTRDTAHALGISESAVKMRLMRARQQLRVDLEVYL